jgi:hypothetical protein
VPKTLDRRIASAPTIPMAPEVSKEEVQPTPTTPFRLEDVKRVVPPERGGGFEAMRELANQSAQRAISNYRTQRGTRDTTRRLVASGVCLASGIGIFTLEKNLLSAAGAGAAAAILASVYFAVRALGSFLVVIRNGSGSDDQTDSESAK